MALIFKNGKYIIRHRPDGKYGAYVPLCLPEGTTEEEARRLNNDIVKTDKVRRGREVQVVSGDTIEDLWTGYENYIGIHRKPRTLDDVIDAGNNLRRILGKNSVEHISNAHLDIYKKTRKTEKGRRKGSKLSPRTINRELSWFSGFMRWCRKNTELKIPHLEIEMLPYTRPIPIILTVKECMDIIRALSPLYKAFVGCLYLTGMGNNSGPLVVPHQNFSLSVPILYWLPYRYIFLG